MSDDVPPLNTVTADNYWEFSDVNPLLRHPLVTPSMIEVEGHRYLSKLYRTCYADGDPEAIFAYMAADKNAFDADWVRQQIRRWKDQNTGESAAQLMRLMQCYIGDRRGHTDHMVLLATIRRDQAIFRELVLLNREQKIPLRDSRCQEGCFFRVAAKYKMTEESVATVYKHYMAAVREAMGKKPPSLLPRSYAPRERRLMKEVEREVGWPEHCVIARRQTLTSWDDVWQWFDTMTENLARLWD